jgi:hypothetical protein
VIDIEEQAKAQCPSCKAGITVRQRPDTKEWVHDYTYDVGMAGRGHAHFICSAHDLRIKNSE